MSKEKHRKLKIDWLGKCPKCERSTVTVSTIKGSLEKLFDGDKVECWCGQTGEIDTGDNIAWIEWEKLEGCVVVPVEPTQTMIDAAQEKTPHFHHGDSWYGTEEISEGQVKACYKAMVEAARGGNE